MYIYIYHANIVPLWAISNPRRQAYLLTAMSQPLSVHCHHPGRAQDRLAPTRSVPPRRVPSQAPQPKQTNLHVYICIYTQWKQIIYTYMYIHTCVHIRICVKIRNTYEYKYICVCIYKYIFLFCCCCSYTCVYIHIYKCVYIYAHIYIHIHVYIRICTYIYIYIYMHK